MHTRLSKLHVQNLCAKGGTKKLSKLPWHILGKMYENSDYIVSNGGKGRSMWHQMVHGLSACFEEREKYLENE